MSKKDSFSQYHVASNNASELADEAHRPTYPAIYDIAAPLPNYPGLYAGASAPSAQSASTATSAFASMQNTAAATSLCAKCSEPISSESATTLVLLSCKHVMHGACFVKAVNEQKAVESCNHDFGGPKNCAHCLASVPLSAIPASVNDRNEVFKFFNKNFVKQYPDTEYSPGFRDHDLRIEQIRAILGIPVPSFLSPDRTDYSQYVRGPNSLTQEQLIADLLRRRRTLDEIFSSRHNFNVQHLYRFGIRTLQGLVELGYDPVRFGGKAYRSKCPFWMLSDLYNFNAENLLGAYDADSLLALKLLPKELWLCGVSMALLAANNLSKKAFLTYSEQYEPNDLFRYLGLQQSHLVSLGVCRSELGSKWNEAAAREPNLRLLLANMRQ